MWEYAAAAAAAPLVSSLLMPRPSAPSGPDYSGIMAMMNTPEMQAYRSQMLRNAFDPQSELYQTALNRALATSSRAMASRGLANSGAGLGYTQGMLQDLAAKFLDNQTGRQTAAYNSAVGGLGQMGGLMANMASGQYNAARANYEDQVRNQMGFAQGIGNIANSALGAYQYQQMMDRMAADRGNMASMMDYWQR
jgi:hypothetical protein